MQYNSIIAFLLKSPLHWLISKGMMTLTYTGRKSGKIYETPVSYVELDDDSDGHLLLTISKVTRTWWRNLRGGADVTLLVRRVSRPAYAEVFSGEAAIPGLAAYVSRLRPVAKSLGVHFDADKKPLADDVRKLSADWMLVQFKL